MSDPVPVYRHEAGNPDRYFYDLQIPNHYGWGDGEIAFGAFGTQEPGTIPIYRHQAGGPDRYFYDTQIPNNYGWSVGQVAFYAYASQQPGTVPIYRHQAGGPDRYFYDTQIPNDYGWSAGQIAFYAYPQNTTLVDDIVGVLGRQGAAYKGVTYQSSTGNRFTLLDTPRLWDVGPSTAADLLAKRKPSDAHPIAACEELLERIDLTIGTFRHRKYIDVVTLWQTGIGLPGGDFQQALSAALWRMNGIDQPSVVRILIGVPTPVIVRDSDLTAWVQQTIERDGRQKIGDVRYPIYIARSHQSLVSWNHAKIVAVDGWAAIVGGHNLWSGPYLGPNPVNDVSCLLEGPGAAAAHSFCNKLWTQAFGNILVLQNGGFSALASGKQPPAFTPDDYPASDHGTTRVLALGRLGGIPDQTTVASNASVSARLMAMGRARASIRISQQSLFFSPSARGFDFYTCLSIVRAIRDGVEVSIVISNEVPLADGGYEGYLRQTALWLTELYVGDRLGILAFPYSGPPRNDLAGWATASLNPPGTFVTSRRPTPTELGMCLSELNSRLRIAPLHYSAGVNYWTVNGARKLAANHAKVYIIDDTHFYVGSDNLYESGSAHGLQEFGYLVEDQAVTQEFIESYWNKLWKNSSPAAVSATRPPGW